jgi:phosphate transport system substrate-binding protein
MKKDSGLWIVYLVVVPIFLSFLGIAVLPVEKFGQPILLLIVSFTALATGIYHGKRSYAETFQGRYLPVYLPLFITVFLATIGMIVSKGFFGHDIWGLFVFALFPFLPNSFISAMMGKFLFAFAVKVRRG